MRKIRVIQLIMSFDIGGAENIAKQYCELLDRNKFDVKVIAIRNSHSFHDEELKKEGVDVFYINDFIDNNLTLIPRSLKRFLHPVLRAFILNRIYKEFKPDIIHFHLALCRTLHCSKPPKGIHLFLTVHNDPEYSWGKKSKWHYDYNHAKWLCKKYDFSFIALHRQMKRILDEFWLKGYPHRTYILNNGINLERYQNLGDKNSAKYSLGIDTSTTVIGHVGSFTPVKNHLFLLDVFKCIKSKLDNSVLLFIGDGIEKDNILKKIDELNLNNSVILLGVRSDVPELLKAIDMIIFPSFSEGLSGTLIEAQVSCVKCIISDTISKDNVISKNLVEFCSLEKSAEYWSEKSLAFLASTKKPYIDTRKWDMKNIVHDLEELYVESVNRS